MEVPRSIHLARQLLQHYRRSRNRLSCDYSRSRGFATSPDRAGERGRDKIWRPRMDSFPSERMAEFDQYPMVTAKELRERRERPRRVKMLARDFMEDSLYNAHYGYFSSQVKIFSPPSQIDFPSLPNEAAFNHVLQQQYNIFEDRLDSRLDRPDPIRQLWHTPTELFSPHYGEAIARFLLANYKLTLYPYHDLIIYELGAGNGTLMRNILDFLRAEDEDVYQRTKYRIIEISASLAELQRRGIDAEHAAKVEIINSSIFDWTAHVPEPNYFLALEVADNLPHDIIRYPHASIAAARQRAEQARKSGGNPPDPGLEPEQDADYVPDAPHQSILLIDAEGDFYEFYTPTLDPVLHSYLALRHRATRSYASRHPTAPPLTADPRTPPFATRLKNALHPLRPQFTEPEYVPTGLHALFSVLTTHFPSHRLLLADFATLPAPDPPSSAVPGVNAPSVQTRYRRGIVNVRTPFVCQGFFDLLFPTQFGLAEEMYRWQSGKLTRVLGQDEFLGRWADLETARTQDGDCPLLGWYRNAGVLMTV